MPWLYVLPIFDILTEIKATMSCQDIVLSQRHRQQDGNVLTNESTTSSRGSVDESIYLLVKQRHQFLKNSTLLMEEVFSTCLGNIEVRKARWAHLNHSAYADHCRYTMGCLEEAGGLNKAAFLDVLQMIRCGLHKQEIVATLQQKHCGPNGLRSVGEFVDRIASLLVMVDIGESSERGNDARLNRVSWMNGSLENTISNYFSGQTDLSAMTIRLDTSFTIANLTEKAGLRISWTSNLADHLRLDGEQRLVHIFHHVAFLECQRNRYASILGSSVPLTRQTVASLLSSAHWQAGKKRYECLAD